jgi:hypothetical protein
MTKNPVSNYKGNYFQYVVEVTAADYNGKTFDGSPLVRIAGDEAKLDALFVSFKEQPNPISINTNDSTDYAKFNVVNHENSLEVAEPGDQIALYEHEGNWYGVVFKTVLLKYTEVVVV